MSQAQRCNNFVWDMPELLRTSAGNRVFVDQPQVVPLDSGTLLLGSWSMEFTDQLEAVPLVSVERPYGAGVFLDSSGTAHSVAPPDTFRWLTVPRGAPTSSGDLAVVWASPDTAGHFVSVLRTASLSGRRWSEVDSVRAGFPLNWWNPSAAVLADDRITVAVGASVSAPSGGALIHRDEHGWKAIPLQMPRLGYAQLAHASADTFALVFVSHAEPHGNTLFAQHVALSGEAIGPRVRISTPTDGTVLEPAMVRAADGFLYVTWAQSDSGRLVFYRLHLARSRDGISWERLPSAEISEGFDLSRPAVNGAGRVHVVMRVRSRDGAPPAHLMWDGREWHRFPVPPVAQAIDMGQPQLLVEHGESPWLLWSMVEQRAIGSSHPVHVVSRSRLTCP